MTGPEHYAEADRLMRFADEAQATPDSRAEYCARAQVHAVLALAAAFGTSADVADAREWRKAAGPGT
jgi:hypothetical protein